MQHFTNTLPTLNEVELMVFKAICEAAERSTGGDFTYAAEVLEYTEGITMKQLRGYLTALIKKELIDVDTKHGSQVCVSWTMRNAGRECLHHMDFPEYFAEAAEEQVEEVAAPVAPAAPADEENNAGLALLQDCWTIARQAGAVNAEAKVTEFKRHEVREFICVMEVTRPTFAQVIKINDEMRAAWGKGNVMTKESANGIEWTICTDYSLD